MDICKTRVEKIVQIMENHNLYGEVSAEDMEEKVIAVSILWGDWKHDHAALKYFVKAEMPGVKNVATEVTEEDGSDTFSAIHRFTF